MSLLSPRVRIALTPGRVAVASGRDYRDAEVAEPGWTGALKALSSLLAGAGLQGRTSVILSHDFAPVHLIPSPPVLLKPAETEGWVRDHLSRQFGDAAREWRIAWQPVPPGEAIVAGSLEPAQLAELEAAIRAMSLKPAEVQPWLAVAWNRQRRRIGKGRAWFALAEPGRLTLAGLEDGRVRCLRSAQMQGDAAIALADLLKREALLAGETSPAPVWIESVLPSVNWQGISQGRAVHTVAGGSKALTALLEH